MPVHDTGTVALTASEVHALEARQQRASPALAAAQIGSAVFLTGMCMWAFPALAPAVSIRALVGTGAVVGSASLLWLLRGTQEATVEDLACGTWISGVPGSGKTSLVIGRVRERMEAGEGGIWLSSKGGSALLPYVPPEIAANQVDWISPASRNPRGINLLRVYGGDAREQELVAGYTVGLFRRLYPQLSENMAELIRMGTMALLSFSIATNQAVTLPHLYLFFHSPGYRRRVLERATNPVLRHSFGDTAVETRTVAAVLRQLRRTVASEALLVSFGQSVGVNLQAAMAGRPGRWVITDADERQIGPEASDLINQVLVSQIELLTPGRRLPRQLWHAVADEIERYQSPSFLRAIEISREYRVAWTLVHQASGQLSDQVLMAARMCGSHIYMQQHPDDVAAAQRVTGRVGERALDFSRLRKRRYVGRIRLQGRPTDVDGYTGDLPEPDEQVAAQIRRANANGPSREAILAPLYRMLDGSGDAPGVAPQPGRGGLSWD